MYQYVYRTWKWSQSDEKCCTVIVIDGLTWLDKQTEGEGQATMDQPPTLPLEKEGPGNMQHGTSYGIDDHLFCYRWNIPPPLIITFSGFLSRRLSRNEWSQFP
jgi:hypothetical protein